MISKPFNGSGEIGGINLMRPSKKGHYFNNLNIDLNDVDYFPPEIYERTVSNPNPNLSILDHTWNDSLDEYASQFCDELLLALRK